jgi:PncC family amidohydrolase
MAQGVKARSGATYGIATTGIAGPDGGTADKPVGLVYIGCAYGTKVRVLRNVFSGNRYQVRTQATEEAFALLQSVMKECEDVPCES